MFVQALICISIPLSWGLIEPLPNPQGEVTLQQLAQGMKSLEHLVQNLTSEITSMKSLEPLVKNQTLEIMSIKKKQDSVVSFKAYMSKSIGFSSGSTLVFDHIESNVGNAYNPTSGVFRAPIAGIYTFSVLIELLDAGNSDFGLFKQGTAEMYVKVQDSYDFRSMTSTMRVGQGEDVFVRKGYDSGQNPRVNGGVWTQFSGYLLRAD